MAKLSARALLVWNFGETATTSPKMTYNKENRVAPQGGKIEVFEGMLQSLRGGPRFSVVHLLFVWTVRMFYVSFTSSLSLFKTIPFCAKDTLNLSSLCSLPALTVRSYPAMGGAAWCSVPSSSFAATSQGGASELNLLLQLTFWALKRTLEKTLYYNV